MTDRPASPNQFERDKPGTETGRAVVAGQPWAGFLGAVEVAITREAETGGGLSYATGEATVCVRFELHGDNGPRRVTIREIDCPPWSPPPPSRT